MSALLKLRGIVGEQLASIRAAGTWKNERVLCSSQGNQINIQGNEKRLLNFCANNYLGLASNLSIVESAKAALDSHGNGLSSVRFICGTQDIHKDLERKLAEFHAREDAILYISCFDANAGLFEALLSEQDALISDELNHASIIDGIRLSKAKKYRYKHRDLNDLEDLLKKADSEGARMKLIVTDGVFSMDGNVAPVRDLVDLADKYGAITFIDECHATGFFGKTGRGTEEYHNAMGKVTIINSTLGKSLGGAAGGYTTGPKEVIDLLRQKSRPYLFSNSPSPPLVAAAGQAIDMLLAGTPLIPKLQENTKLFREKMKKAGFNILGDDHPICPVMMPDDASAVAFADQMLAHGIYVIGFTYPVVPKGKARIRTQMSAAHSRDEVEQCIAAFIEVGRARGMIP